MPNLPWANVNSSDWKLQGHHQKFNKCLPLVLIHLFYILRNPAFIVTGSYYHVSLRSLGNYLAFAFWLLCFQSRINVSSFLSFSGGSMGSLSFTFSVIDGVRTTHSSSLKYPFFILPNMFCNSLVKEYVLCCFSPCIFSHWQAILVKKKKSIHLLHSCDLLVLEVLCSAGLILIFIG